MRVAWFQDLVGHMDHQIGMVHSFEEVRMAGRSIFSSCCWSHIPLRRRCRLYPQNLRRRADFLAQRLRPPTTPKPPATSASSPVGVDGRSSLSPPLIGVSHQSAQRAGLDRHPMLHLNRTMPVSGEAPCASAGASPGEMDDPTAARAARGPTDMDISGV